MISNESRKKLDRINAMLREAIIEEIGRQGLDNTQLAERLGLLPSGAELLVSRDYWPIETGLRIADALNLGIELLIKRDNG